MELGSEHVTDLVASDGQQVALCFGCAVSPMDFCVETLGPKLVVLFWEVVKPFESGT